MSDAKGFERMLRWYPPHWRSKYAEGMAALLEDTYGTGRVPMNVRLSLVKSGTLRTGPRGWVHWQRESSTRTPARRVAARAVRLGRLHARRGAVREIHRQLGGCPTRRG